ncbi:MAG: ATP-binding cassette domain-containing protein [Nitrososphaerales archaeon]
MEEEIATTQNNVICNGLTKIYSGKRKNRAIDSLNFSIPSTGIFALIGRNGSGKTTLVRILSTELKPTLGSVSINGIDVINDPDRLREKIAIVPQEARAVPWMTPTQTVLSYLLWRGFDYGVAKQRAIDTLGRLGLGRQANTLNRTLSGGNKRKVLVATVLASEAEIIFLDEPTTGLDPISRKEFWGLLKEIGRERFTFLTTHYLEEAEELGDRIGILDRGRLIGLGTLDELRQRANYNYSMKLPPAIPIPHVTNGEAIEGKDGTRILTTEEEAFKISRELSRSGYKFTINPISLDDIFFYLVNREGNKAEIGNQRGSEPAEEGEEADTTAGENE